MGEAVPLFCLPLVPAAWRQSEIKLPGAANQRHVLHFSGPHNSGTPISIQLVCRDSLRIHGYQKHLMMFFILLIIMSALFNS